MNLTEKNNIDFDDASMCWRQNKIKLSQGKYKYICEYVHKDGKQCHKGIDPQHFYNIKKLNDKKFEKYKYLNCKKHCEYLCKKSDS
jgi:hypothetical protein